MLKEKKNNKKKKGREDLEQSKGNSHTGWRGNVGYRCHLVGILQKIKESQAAAFHPKKKKKNLKISSRNKEIIDDGVRTQ